MNNRIHLFPVVLAALFLLSKWGLSDTRGQGGLVDLGTVKVDPESRTVLAEGWVNQVIGPIELLICGPGGKTHESVFVMQVNPMELQAGLLLLGLKAGTPPTAIGTGKPSGPGLAIWVDWEQDGRKVSRRAEQFLFDRLTEDVLPETKWVFTGSVVVDGEFKAMAEESLVATYWDPWAIVNIPWESGADDEALIVNTNIVPPIKTPVVFRIQPER